MASTRQRARTRPAPAAPIPIIIGGRSDAAIRRACRPATGGSASGTPPGVSPAPSRWRRGRRPRPGGPTRPGTRCRCGAGWRTPRRRPAPASRPRCRPSTRSRSSGSSATAPTAPPTTSPSSSRPTPTRAASSSTWSRSRPAPIRPSPPGRRQEAPGPGMTAPLVVAPRFCGPPDSANGGYASGLIAACLDGQAEITLRRPPPLARPMAVERDGEGSVRVLDGDVLIAEGHEPAGQPGGGPPRPGHGPGRPRRRPRIPPAGPPGRASLPHLLRARACLLALGRAGHHARAGRLLLPYANAGIPVSRSRDRAAIWRPSSSGRRSTAPGPSGRSGTPPRMGRPTCWAGSRPASSARSGRASRMS